jgi:integrase
MLIRFSFIRYPLTYLKGVVLKIKKMKISLFLKRGSEQETSLYTEFKKNGIKFRFYPGKVVQAKHWSPTKQMCLSGHKNAEEINLYLCNWKKELERIIDQLEANKEVLTKTRIQQELNIAFKRKGEQPLEPFEGDFMTFYDKFIHDHHYYTKASRTILKQNRKHVIAAFNLVSKKTLDDYNKLGLKSRGLIELRPERRLPFDRITSQFLKDFRHYMHTATFHKYIDGVRVILNYKKNYIGKHVKQLQQIVQEAMSEEYKLVPVFVIKKNRKMFEEVDSIYTNLEELERFVNLNLDGVEDKVRDLYVFNSFCGMRYSDLKLIEKHLFEWRTIDGERVLVFTDRQQKTNSRVEFPIHPNAWNILEKYKYQLPRVNDQVFNRLIKKVAFLAGLTEKFRTRETRGYNATEVTDTPKYMLISSHTGRRSFCTNYYHMDVNIQAIMAISGHKTEKEFLKYVKTGVKVSVINEQLKKIPLFKKTGQTQKLYKVA